MNRVIMRKISDLCDKECDLQIEEEIESFEQI